MRLLTRVKGELVVTSDQPVVDTPYAILSHTWSDNDRDEVSYTDIITKKDISAKPGHKKLEFCLRRAEAQGLSHVWIDTCCIDRGDQNELSSALNMMCEWYAKATVCYAYLADVSLWDLRAGIRQSQWFKRGWTMQELWAPSTLLFFTKEGYKIGSRDEMRQTRKGPRYMHKLKDLTLSQRFKESFSRKTRRPEDMSYCLLGPLEVSMPINYGEGYVRARDRLLEAFEKEYGRKLAAKLRQIQLDHDNRPRTSAKSSETSEDESDYASDDNSIASYDVLDDLPCTDGLPSFIAALVQGKTTNKSITKRNLKQRDSEGRTALFYAMSPTVDTELLRKMLVAGADTDATNDKGQTCLSAALEQGITDTEKINCLLEHGIDETIRDNQGWDAVDYACSKGYILNVEQLLGLNDSASLDWFQTIEEVTRPIMLATLYGRSKLLRRLCKGRDLSSPVVDILVWTTLHAAYSYLPLEHDSNADFRGILNLVTQRHLSVRPQYGDTPLHFACRHTQHPEIAEFIIKHSYDYCIDEQRNADGKTPLQVACAHQNGDIAGMLIMHGANPSQLTDEEKTGIETGFWHTSVCDNPIEKADAEEEDPRCIVHGSQPPPLCTCSKGPFLPAQQRAIEIRAHQADQHGIPKPMSVEELLKSFDFKGPGLHADDAADTTVYV